MTTGAFADWQPRYAEYGIATFPVRDKKPAVRGYLHVGPALSRKFARRFADADAFGFALEPAGVVVVDVDTPDERILAEALDRHGPSPLVVRSGGGNFQVWYRRRNERRLIRPEKHHPIDILGEGYVVAPPSIGSLGRYGSRSSKARWRIRRRLPFLLNPPAGTTLEKVVGPGSRNDTLWRRCMTEAPACDDFDAMLDVARTSNTGFEPQLPDPEIVKTAKSAWDYTDRAETGSVAAPSSRPRITRSDGLLEKNPDALVLLIYLRRHHWGRGVRGGERAGRAYAGRPMDIEAAVRRPKAVDRSRDDHPGSPGLQLSRPGGLQVLDWSKLTTH